MLKENYRWYKNGEKLEDGVSRQLSSVGIYRCITIFLIIVSLYNAIIRVRRKINIDQQMGRKQ
jgi:hypothetical protein